MKPLVNYCRWNQARLRLHGRDDDRVWGQLVFETAGGHERLTPFTFELATSTLRLQDGERETSIKLDEMGVERRDSDT